mgnify:CR=1 FL=1
MKKLVFYKEKLYTYKKQIKLLYSKTNILFKNLLITQSFKKKIKIVCNKLNLLLQGLIKVFKTLILFVFKIIVLIFT